jgi:hypothetical protein
LHESLFDGFERRALAAVDRGAPRKKRKGILRKVEARSREALIEAMDRALDAITLQEARGFFEHRGYRVAGQPL